ncbi:cupin domain-containing protein [Chitinophaga pendula]|uniref:JmjC domain-containing protein n=1 Tax=Chitinophaga TaxID=79328 RepID=UPI000BAEA5AB|nr:MULTISPECIES: cupin domain-containing protein [Chitinophaga]ASZ11953.1 hypothetical protein CK934_13785 [Chitinophaga sp. MD30]UCJ05019.1 cupin domain-containing protein [Chitinophaga pendula]
MKNDFSWIISPCAKTSFLQDYFEQNILHIKRNDLHSFDQCSSLDIVAAWLANAVDPVPYQVVLEDNTTTLAAARYMHIRALPGNVRLNYGIDIETVFRLFSEGKVNIAFKNIQGQLPMLDDLTAALTEELNCSCESQLYFTPPTGVPTYPRYETADMFILQITGSRKWKIYQGPISLPLPSQANQPFDLSQQSLIHQCITQPGDTLYIPRGFIWESFPLEQTAVFAAVKFTFPTYLRLILDILKDIGNTAGTLRETAFLNDLEDNNSLKKAANLLGEKIETQFNTTTFDNLSGKRRPPHNRPSSCDPQTLKAMLTALASLHAND